MISDAKSSKRKAKSAEKPLASLPSFDLSDAVRTLTASRIVHTETKGVATEVKISYPPELLNGLRAMFGAHRTYDFQMHYNATLAATGGGVITTYLAWNPTTLSEWSALSALFDETRLMSTQLTWTSAFGPTSTAIIVQIALAPDFITNGSNPSGFNAVSRLAESKEFGIAMPGPGGATTMHRRVRVGRRIYAPVTSPVSNSLDMGWNGQWSIASNIVTTATINYAFIVMRSIGRFRQRA